MYECTTNTKLNYVLYNIAAVRVIHDSIKKNQRHSLSHLNSKTKQLPARPKQKPLKNIWFDLNLRHNIQLHFFSKINYTTNYYYYSRPPRFHGKDTHTPQQQQQQIIIVYYNVWQNQEIKWLYQNQSCNFFSSFGKNNKCMVKF